MVLEYIDKNIEFPKDIDLYIAENVILVCDQLKLRKI